jgi:hypothetical protein
MNFSRIFAGLNIGYVENLEMPHTHTHTHTHTHIYIYIYIYIYKQHKVINITGIIVTKNIKILGKETLRTT